MSGDGSHDVLVCAKCQGRGTSACKGCWLVLYCGGECQKAHWSTHKQDCRSPLNKNSWKPQWELENRTPAFINGAGEAREVGSVQKVFGGKKFFWGNMPALDVLRMADNEGKEYDEDIRLLFAASGDLRNVVKTIASIPAEYSKELHANINDKDFDIVARNAIMLLILLAVPETNQAVECMIHVWYSARIRQADLDILRSSVRPLIQDVCSKIAGKPANKVLGKTWTFGNRSLRLVLTKEQWTLLLD